MNFQCKVCQKYLKSSQGLKSHCTRLHKCPSNAENDSSSSQSSNGSIEDTESFAKEVERERNLGSFLASQKTRVKAMRRIPKGARSAAAEAFSECIQACLRDNNISSWERLLCFAGACLQVPAANDTCPVSLTTAVKRNIADFRVNNPVNSSHNASPPPRLARPSQMSHDHDDWISKSVEAKIADGDVVGAIRILSSEDSFAPFNVDTCQALSALHPAHEGTNWPESNGTEFDPIPLPESAVKGAITSFPPGSAGGLDMLSPQHLKDMISHSTGVIGQRLLTSLSSICALMFRGEVPAAICPVLYGASLFALNKKGGGIRPIAVGCTLRRLAAKVGSNFIKPSLGPKLFPTQLGFGTRGGAEAAAHSARRFFSFNHPKPKCFLKMDFSNAFNSVRRDTLLQVVLTECPQLFPFLYQCYRHPSLLFFGESTILSQRGIQQGDPLGPALFCAIVQSVASSLKSEMNIWYLDDAAVGGAPEDVLADFLTVKQKSTDLGLSLNFGKCELFPLNCNEEKWAHSKSLFSEAAPGIRFPGPEDCSLLGAPLQVEAVTKCLRSKTSALNRISTRLSLIKAHTAFFILKNSLAIPKLTYLLRCAPTWNNTDSLAEFDSTLREALDTVINIHLTEDSWEQAALPIKMGGLGIRHASSVALPAFLSSASSVSPLTMATLPRAIASTPDDVLLEGIATWEVLNHAQTPKNPGSQKEWENPATIASQNQLYERATQLQNKARLLGVASKESGAFLHALPSPTLGTLLDDNSFRIAVALRIGANICQPHTCICGNEVEANGYHGLSCRRNAGRLIRHSTVNDLIRRGLVSAGIPATLEPTHLSRDNNLRPDGVTQIPWKDGKALTWDFTCVDSLATSHLASSAGIPVHAASEAEMLKRRKYSSMNTSFNFCPIAAECLGSFGKDSAKLLADIGRRIVSNTGEKRAAEFLLQRISIAIQRGNAIAIMATIPPQASLEDFICLL